MKSEREIKWKLIELENWGFWRKFMFGFESYKQSKKILKWVLDVEGKK